jgi:hypothetical protein
MAGYVYIMINQAFPHLLKIGKTEKNPDERARELSSTGVPSPFIVLHNEYVADCATVESEMHRLFAQFRESSRREFFRIERSEAIRVLSELAKKYPADAHSQRVKQDEAGNFYIAVLECFPTNNFITINEKYIDTELLRKKLRNNLRFAYCLEAPECLIIDNSDLIWDHSIYRLGFTQDAQDQLEENLFEYYVGHLGMKVLPRCITFKDNCRSSALDFLYERYRESFFSVKDQLLLATHSIISSIMSDASTFSLIQIIENMRTSTPEMRYRAQLMRRRLGLPINITDDRDQGRISDLNSKI